MKTLTQLVLLSAALLMGGPAFAACPFTPPPIRDLDLERFYSDNAGSKIDPDLKAKHKAETQPIRNYIKTVTGQADLFLSERTEGLAAYRATCALEWLRIWAQGGALAGEIKGKQSGAERRWTLAGLAIAYLKVKNAAKPEDRAVIEPWLSSLAGAASAEFETEHLKHNNHYYWLGLGLAATSLAAGDKAQWEKARAIITEAANGIGPDGTLKLELERESRALHYHAFALMPLLTLAELAKSKGEDWYALNGGALHRLVATTYQGIEKPETFAKLARSPQETPVKPGAGWLQLYRANFPDRLPEPSFELPSGDPWLGGNVGLLRKLFEAKQELPH